MKLLKKTSQDYGLLTKYLGNKAKYKEFVAPEKFNEKGILKYICENREELPKKYINYSSSYLISADKNLKNSQKRFFVNDAKALIKKLDEKNRLKEAENYESVIVQSLMKGYYHPFLTNNPLTQTLVSSELNEDNLDQNYSLAKEWINSLCDYIKNNKNIVSINKQLTPLVLSYLNDKIERTESILSLPLDKNWEIGACMDSLESIIGESNMKDIDVCIFPPIGKYMGASIAYAIDKNVEIVTLKSSLKGKSMPEEEKFGRAILVKAKENGEDVLVIDGVLISKSAETMLKACDLDWQKLFLRQINYYAASNKIDRIILNACHGKKEAQQCVHDFIKYTSDLIGLKENEDYEIKKEGGVREFRLSKEYLEKNLTKELNGFKATHLIEKEPLDKNLVRIMSKGKQFSGYKGEQYFHSTYSCNKHMNPETDSKSCAWSTFNGGIRAIEFKTSELKKRL